MKVAGIIGGIAPESTIDYYRLLISGFRKKSDANDYPRILINSINMTRMLGLVADRKFDDLADYLSQEIRNLAAGGADFAALASNTPHIIFDRLREKAAVPMVSIIEETCKKARSAGLKKVGLFGTKFTMEGGFYQSLFMQNGIDIVIPDTADQQFIHEKYMNEFVNGIFLESTKKRLIHIADSMLAKTRIEALILGGTELPLVLKEQDVSGLTLLNTTAIHVESLVDIMVQP